MTSTVVQWNAQLVKNYEGKYFNKGSFDNQNKILPVCINNSLITNIYVYIYIYIYIYIYLYVYIPKHYLVQFSLVLNFL